MVKVNFRLFEQSVKTVTIEVPSRNTTVGQMRTALGTKVNTPPERLRLLYGGKQLEDSPTLFHYDIKNSDIVLVQIRLELPSQEPLATLTPPDSTPNTPPEEPIALEAAAALEATAKSTTNVPNDEQSSYVCMKCKNVDTKKCKDCGCRICGGKEDEDNTLACDDCQFYFHMKCLSPPLETIPEGDWYCNDCYRDPNRIVGPGQQNDFANSKKAKMPSASQTKDWGRGNACAGLTKKCTIVEPTHRGPIPGVPVGSSWLYRLGAAEAGVHRPPVSGIAGTAKNGAVSIVLAGGYPEDMDDGLEFTYTGAGGRDLKEGNKRVGQQTKAQELTGSNEALARTCDCQFTGKNGTAKDWRKSKPVRVIRSAKLKKHNPTFAPEQGNRYDGIYKVVKYWLGEGEAGLPVWRYYMRRDDPAPAPWTPEGKEMIKKLRLVMHDPSKTDEENRVGHPGYKIPQDLLALIKKDTGNDRSWEIVRKTPFYSYGELIRFVIEEMFACSICSSKVQRPVTTHCTHTFCQGCLKGHIKNVGENCPTCRASIEGRTLDVNTQLQAVFDRMLISDGLGGSAVASFASESSESSDSDSPPKGNGKGKSKANAKGKGKKRGLGSTDDQDEPATRRPKK
ncbi:E3 ubiquitin-protein ligase uhrf1 [Podila verticillata]|nr:E3 ubiquitin-protein ligase uhrf1 [Podila verticillata]